ncbi:Uncharacterised protein [Pseudomonas aeruginosa]|nr:Uncharacterised protein [Pseudomonas aeruginosa]
MNTTTRISTAERLGRTFGRGWRAYARGERRASNWLVSKGGAGGRCHRARVGGQAVCGGIAALRCFFGSHSCCLGVVAAAWAAAANTSDEDEWPFTDLTELRKTPGYDPNLYNDTSHELYTDD